MRPGFHAVIDDNVEPGAHHSPSEAPESTPGGVTTRTPNPNGRAPPERGRSSFWPQIGFFRGK